MPKAPSGPPQPSGSGSYNGETRSTSGNGMHGQWQWTGGSHIGGRGGHWKLINAGGNPGKDYKKN